MIKLPIKEKGGVVMRKGIVEQDDNTPKVIYHAIKFGDKYLARLGSELTSDLGQARLYKNLETWYKNNESILKKLGKANYKIVGVTLKESKEQ